MKNLFKAVIKISLSTKTVNMSFQPNAYSTFYLHPKAHFESNSKLNEKSFNDRYEISDFFAA